MPIEPLALKKTSNHDGDLLPLKAGQDTMHVSRTANRLQETTEESAIATLGAVVSSSLASPSFPAPPDASIMRKHAEKFQRDKELLADALGKDLERYRAEMVRVDRKLGVGELLNRGLLVVLILLASVAMMQDLLGNLFPVIRNVLLAIAGVWGTIAAAAQVADPFHKTWVQRRRLEKTVHIYEDAQTDIEARPTTPASMSYLRAKVFFARQVLRPTEKQW